jgi:hypothetical protein
MATLQIGRCCVAPLDLVNAFPFLSAECDDQGLRETDIPIGGNIDIVRPFRGDEIAIAKCIGRKTSIEKERTVGRIDRVALVLVQPVCARQIPTKSGRSFP